MMTYQVRPRTFYVEGTPLLPGLCRVRFHFQPLQAFGVEAGGGRTFVQAVSAKATFNANNGEFTIESDEPLRPLAVLLPTTNGTIQLTGSTLTITEQFATLDALDDFILSVFVGLPALLNVAFADPPYIWRVEGDIGEIGFAWQLARWTTSSRPTTQDEQEAAVAAAVRRMTLVGVPHRRRLLAGLHYFHVACRLARKGDIVGEFMAEVILNLAKTLEVLFPAVAGGGSRDAVRAGLAGFSFSEQEIEGNFLPAIALRNEIDVAHVELGLFTTGQLKVIHAFTERAEGAFSEMLKRLLKGIESGAFDITAYAMGSPRPEAIALIDRLEKVTPKTDAGIF